MTVTQLSSVAPGAIDSVGRGSPSSAPVIGARTSCAISPPSTPSPPSSNRTDRRRRRFAPSTAVPRWSFEEVLTDARIAAVAIATPPSQHYSARRKKRWRPASTSSSRSRWRSTLERGRRARAASPSARPPPDGRAHLLQYHPAFLKLKDLVREGRLGRLQYLYSNRLNLGKIRREEDILWSFAPHDVSMILSLVGTGAGRSRGRRRLLSCTGRSPT